MKLLVVSDIIVPELTEAGLCTDLISGVDLVLSCGDLPPEYLDFLSRKTDAPLFYVLGNHDIRHDNLNIPGCQHLHRRIQTFRNVRFMGLGGSRWYNGGPNQYRESQMQMFLRGLWLSLFLHRGVDVVLTHAPPWGVGDAEDPCHRGFLGFRRFVERYQPLYFLHGHIHKDFKKDDERKSWLKNTQIINCFGAYVLYV